MRNAECRAAGNAKCGTAETTVSHFALACSSFRIPRSAFRIPHSAFVLSPQVFPHVTHVSHAAIWAGVSTTNGFPPVLSGPHGLRTVTDVTTPNTRVTLVTV